MTKDVLITIRGVHTMDEEDNDVEMIVRGDYYQKNGKHYVLYEELLEGFKEPVKNIIKITPTSMDITKKGTATTHMLFEKNRKNISCYSTPLGEMVVGIQANHFAVDEQADSLKVNVDYSLDINYEHMSDCRILVDVQSCQNKPRAPRICGETHLIKTKNSRSHPGAGCFFTPHIMHLYGILRKIPFSLAELEWNLRGHS